MATETVVVYCKIPNGYHLTVKDAAGVDHTYRINGPLNKKQQPDAPVIFGHGATRIPKEFWEEWLAEHKELEPVKREHIFATAKPQDGKAMARERKDNRTGLEGIDPKKPGPGLEPAESMKPTLEKLPPQFDLV